MSADGWVKKIQIHSPDVVESLAEKVGRLNEDGKRELKTSFSKIDLYLMPGVL